MATAAPSQDFKNHQKFVPAFHYVALPLLLVNLIYSGYVAVTSFSLDSVMALLLAVAVMIVAFLARFFALGAQDRVIRLEERLRLHRGSPAGSETHRRRAKYRPTHRAAVRFRW